MELVGPEPPAADASQVQVAVHRAEVLNARVEYLMRVIEHGMVGIAAAVHTAPAGVLGEMQEVLERVFSCSEMMRILGGPAVADAAQLSADALATGGGVPMACGRCGRDHPTHNCWAATRVETGAPLPTPHWLSRARRNMWGAGARLGGGDDGGDYDGMDDWEHGYGDHECSRGERRVYSGRGGGECGRR